MAVSAALLLAIAGIMALPNAPAALAYNETRPVLAYYYSWWRPFDFDRTLYKPFAAYNSDDAAVMRDHLAQASSAGIDGFVMSWRGVGHTDDNLARLMDMALEYDMRATVHVETPFIATGNFAGAGPLHAGDVVAHLEALYRTRLNHAAIVTYQGRPVIFFWRASTFDNATWNAIRAQVDPHHHAVWIADGDRFDILQGEAWDGISPYAIAWSDRPAAHLAGWAANARAAAPGKLFIPPVSPGCDDSAARTATCVNHRGDGSYYQSTLDGALATNPEWAVIVSTWNEWMESTQIESGTAYGDLYLHMTRQFADAFKGAAPAFAPLPEPEPVAPEEWPGVEAYEDVWPVEDVEYVEPEEFVEAGS